jgi:hypothetical protein
MSRWWARPPATTSRPDGPAKKKALISHANDDELLAIELVKYFETAGCACWISFRDVDPGEDYRLSITKAMNGVAFLVLVYSHHVNISFDIATELLARKRQRKRFVPRTDDTEPVGPVEYELATVVLRQNSIRPASLWFQTRSFRHVLDTLGGLMARFVHRRTPAGPLCGDRNAARSVGRAVGAPTVRRRRPTNSQFPRYGLAIDCLSARRAVFAVPR